MLRQGQLPPLDAPLTQAIADTSVNALISFPGQPGTQTGAVVFINYVESKHLTSFLPRKRHLHLPWQRVFRLSSSEQFNNKQLKINATSSK